MLRKRMATDISAVQYMHNILPTSSPSRRILGALTKAKLSTRSAFGFVGCARTRVSPDKTLLTLAILTFWYDILSENYLLDHQGVSRVHPRIM